MSAVHGDVAGGVLNRGCGCCQRHDWAAFQKPNQAGAVVAAQPPIRRMRPFWRGVEAEQAG